MSATPTPDLPLPTNSRFRNTQVFARDFDVTDENGNPTKQRRIYFGTWRPPEVVEHRPTSIHVVASDEAGNGSLVAHRVYGDKSMWWAIALRNNIDFALVELTAGRRLICPHVEDVSSALAAAVPSGTS